MSTPFSRTTRALQADRFGPSGLALACAAALLTAWGGWLLAARVAVYAVAEQARLEVERAVHPVEAPVAGRIAAVGAGLGEVVEAGAVLFELDAEAEGLWLAEARAYHESLQAQQAALRQEEASGQRALGEAGEARAAALDETRARYEEAEAAARQAEAMRDRQLPLLEQRLLSEAEYQRIASEAQQRRAAAEALRQASRRAGLSRLQEQSDRRAELDRLTRELARLDGDIASTAAAIARLEHALAERRVRAPVAGRIGELAELRVGSVVRAGDRLGSVVPSGELRVVARFAPSAALGRIVPGQPARLRLDGFPATRYGTVAAVVSRVASEVQDGLVRVELELQPGATARVPLSHGLPGTAEVQVERLSPAALVLRHTGRLLQAR